MLAWRLCRARYADLGGEGARRFGGRWNSPGKRLVYAASTAPLAVLEVRVHLDLPIDLIPDDHVLLSIDLAVERVGTMPADPRAFGDLWLAEQRCTVLEAPSSIVLETTNLLLNPDHPAAGLARTLSQRRFAFDPGLWLRG